MELGAIHGGRIGVPQNQQPLTGWDSKAFFCDSWCKSFSPHTSWSGSQSLRFFRPGATQSTRSVAAKALWRSVGAKSCG